MGHISILGSGVALGGCSCQTISETLATEGCETVRHIPEKRVGGTGTEGQQEQNTESQRMCYTGDQTDITGLPLQPKPYRSISSDWNLGIEIVGVVCVSVSQRKPVTPVRQPKLV